MRVEEDWNGEEGKETRRKRRRMALWQETKKMT